MVTELLRGVSIISSSHLDTSGGRTWMKAATPSDDKQFPQADEEIQLAFEGGGKIPHPTELIELLQVSHLRMQSAHYTIFDGRYLSVHQKKPWQKAKRYWLHLGFLDPTPHLLSIIDWRSLYVAGGLAVAMLFTIALSAYSPIPWQAQPWLPVTAALACATLLALGTSLVRSRHLVRFLSISGDAVFLELANNSPARNEFSTFLRTLIQHIHAVHRHDPRKPYQRLGAELVEHRRLLDKEILTQDAYDSAREKILRRHRQAHAHPAKPLKPALPAQGETEIIEVTMANGTWQSELKRRSA
jgi:hypothetical protein